MRLSSRRKYAAYLQEKFESYFKDFTRREISKLLSGI